MAMADETFDKTIVYKGGNDDAMPADGDTTLRPSDRTLLAGGAMMQTTGSTLEPADRTLRPQGAAMPQTPMFSAQANGLQVFNLKGEAYQEVRQLSDNSGEAQVFLVSKDDKEYVLKVYYPNFDVNKKVLQTVRSLQFEMIVSVYDYGKTYVGGKNRHYELMEYLRGGTLHDVKLEGDVKRFRRLALQGAAALAYCHKSGLLHKDVKPTNFFFRDEARKQLVLGDFGISALQDEPGKPFRTTQARTPIYAAPEMYVDVIDGIVDITEAADYYSLGMTLFALWLGENPISTNERNMMKLKNEGRLPRLGELPENVRTLIQGLTAVNQQSRWGYQEVERWFLGEDVAVDISSPFLRYKSFMVDPERNLMADNVLELVPMMLQNEQLAKNYLYDGQIVQWLDACGNTKLSVLVRNIVSYKYPNDQQAGLMAACFAMTPTLPYHDLDGMACEDVHDLSTALLTHADKYGLLLRNPNDTVFLWLESHTKLDITRLRSFFGDDSDGRVGVLRLAYEIDPDLPFLPKVQSMTIEEIVHAFGHDNLPDDSWHSLVDGRLLSWLYAHYDLTLIEPVRKLTEGQTYSKSLAYKVLYTLQPTVAYDLVRAMTPAAVGELLANQLVEQQSAHNSELPAIFADFVDTADGRFAFFAKKHGWHQLLAEAKACFDLDSEENHNRLGAYDLRTALYRFCRILGGRPPYRLADGTVLTDGQRLPQLVPQQVRSDMRNGALAQWLAVAYHEDPDKDFTETYSYERELEAWVMAIGRLDPQNQYYCRFMKAREDTQARTASVKKQWKAANYTEKLWKYGFLAVALVWIAMIFIYGLADRSYMFSHPITTFILPVGGMSGIIVATRSYFKGFGSTISMLIGALGFASVYIPYYTLRYIDAEQPGLFHLAVAAFSAVYIAICYLTDFKRSQNIDPAMFDQVLKNQDIRSQLLEPLYYTFKTRSQRYKASSFSLLDEVSDQVRSMSGETVVHYMLWTLFALVMIVVLSLLSPDLLGLLS